jgi:hypothetical protein
MAKGRISGGTAHALPADLRKALVAAPKALATWEDVTPLARNEWICWVQSVKRAETRDEHVARAASQLAGGKRRPCCWYGCVHRTDKEVGQSVRAVVLEKRKKEGR